MDRVPYSHSVQKNWPKNLFARNLTLKIPRSQFACIVDFTVKLRLGQSKEWLTNFGWEIPTGNETLNFSEADSFVNEYVYPFFSMYGLENYGI